MAADLHKGTRIRACWLHEYPSGYATEVDLTGTCRHFRGDDPTNPTTIRIYVEPDGDVPDCIPRTRPYGCTCPGHDLLVEVRPEWVVGVIDG